jgi:hypothetical protein
MLFALTSPHPSLSLEDFNTWYDTHHAPSRAVCPGVHHVSRFRAESDSGKQHAEAFRKGGSSPTADAPWEWLAMYELESEDALETEEYKKAREADREDERRMFDFLSRRVYRVFSDKRRDDYSTFTAASGGKSRDLTMVSLEPDPASDLSVEEYHRWYEEEHVPALATCPGWLRSSRWELVDARDPRESNGEQTGFARFLTLHEWEDADVLYASPEVKDAVTTPWRDRIIPRCDAKTEERRLLRLWKQF